MTSQRTRDQLMPSVRRETMEERARVGNLVRWVSLARLECRELPESLATLDLQDLNRT